jgi:hypothetical protein
LTLLMSACATPQPQGTAAATDGGGQMVVSRGTQPEGQKLICTESYPMGSHIPQRICLTKEQAEARKRASQAAMQNLQSQGSVQGMGNNPP